MNFLTYLDVHEPRETVANLAASAEKRFYDALTLSVHEGRTLASIYLSGYVVEILLKVAYYRLGGLRGMDDIRGAFKVVENWLRKNGYGNAHDLNGLLHLLRAERTRTGRVAWSAKEQRDVQAAVGLVAGNWRESLRYKYTSPPDDDTLEVKRWV